MFGELIQGHESIFPNPIEGVHQARFDEGILSLPEINGKQFV